MRGRWTLASGVPLRWLALVLLVLLALVLVVLLVLVVVVLALGGGHTGSSGDFTPLHFPPLALAPAAANHPPSQPLTHRSLDRVTVGAVSLFKAASIRLLETWSTAL